MAAHLRLGCSIVWTTLLVKLVTAQTAPAAPRSPIQDVKISCTSNDILVNITTDVQFNGMIYPKGLSKNSSCMAEYRSSDAPVLYTLPLRGCNTMNVELEDGVEYFNTIVVQPHRKLVTSLGRGYHVRCKYHTEEKSVDTDFNVGSLGTTPLSATAVVPGSGMHIYSDPTSRTVAEDVQIGDPLTLEVRIDDQLVYGMLVTDCVVRDGLGWTEQPLIDSDGCPVELDILGELQYNEAKTVARVNFQAHKFPYTASVYYQCNVRLCLHHTGGCDVAPPVCGKNGASVRRRRRALGNWTSPADPEDDEEPLIEVFSGLYVSEGNQVIDDDDSTPNRRSQSSDADSLCVSPRLFAIIIAVIGIILMMVVIITLMVIISRRRVRKTCSAPATSSIYSGPYINSIYSRSS